MEEGHRFHLQRVDESNQWAAEAKAKQVSVFLKKFYTQN